MDDLLIVLGQLSLQHFLLGFDPWSCNRVPSTDLSLSLPWGMSLVVLSTSSWNGMTKIHVGRFWSLADDLSLISNLCISKLYWLCLLNVWRIHLVWIQIRWKGVILLRAMAMAVLRAFWNSPVGPKTTHFWGPVANGGFVVAVSNKYSITYTLPICS